MAWMNQEKKAAIAAELKKAMPKDWKYSLAVRNHSTLVLTIASAPVNLVAAYAERGCSDEVKASMLSKMHADVNSYHFEKSFTGDLLETMKGIFKAMNLNNHDNSDPMTDYYDVGHYVDVQFGRWNKPFTVAA